MSPMMTTESIDKAAANARVVAEDRYDEFLSAVRARFARLVGHAGRLFTTDAGGERLWEAYLGASPDGTRQSRTCRTCEHFIKRYGGLVTIGESGETASPLWDPAIAPPAYREAARSLARIVRGARVDGVVISSEKIWGRAETGPWTHFAVEAPATLVWTKPLLTADQAAAEKAQDYQMLQRGLADFPYDAVAMAHSYLTNGSLYRSEKCVGVAKWLLELHSNRTQTKNSRDRDNVVWLAVAGAPAGFAHVRTSMIGTLLEDIVAGLPFQAIKERFNAKMNPMHYQRAQAAPSAGNIAQAEKIVAALQSAGSLSRRFAKLADVQAIWLPRPPVEEKPSGGVFDHLKHGRQAASPATSDAPSVTMTWDKFYDIVLPGAEAIEFLVPHERQGYTAFVTAADPQSAPIVQWDSAEHPNPVTWYVHHGGSAPNAWNLRAGAFHPVTAVVLQPSMWGDKAELFAHHGAAVCFVLKDARDVHYVAGGGLFTELLKGEYHAVRATIEAFAKHAVIAGKDDAEVCGIRLQKGQTWNLTFRVTANGIRTTYRLDRWD